MTGQEFCTLIKLLGLSQERAGLWLGKSPRMGQRYAAGFPVPPAIARLLRLMVARGYSVADVERITGGNESD